MLASFCTQIWQFYLTQGILVGIGTSLSYIPAVTVTPGWYDKHRGLAMGVVLSGTGLGGLVWAPITRILITKVGFRNALRITGALSFGLLAAASSVLRWAPGYGAPRRGFVLVDWRIARGRVFVLKSCAACLQAAGYYL